MKRAAPTLTLQPVFRRRLRGKQPPEAHMSTTMASNVEPKPAVTVLGRTCPAKPVLPQRSPDAQEVNAISSSAVAAAPGWIRRLAKSESGLVQVHASVSTSEPQASKTKQEALADMWSKLRRGGPE